MTNNLTTICIIVVTCITLSACAQSKKSTAKDSKNKTAVKGKKLRQTGVDNSPVLLQATLQSTLPGQPETPVKDEYRFVVIWNSDKEPAGFFWRGTQTWMPCDIKKVKNYKPLVLKKGMDPYYINYETDETSSKTYSKGDTLELYPTPSDKHPIPSEVPLEKNNVIYYKTVNSTWMPLPVDSITNLPDIIMP